MFYFDNNATTFLADEVKEKLKIWLDTPLGNPSSIHHLGQKARALLIDASRKIADYFDAKPDELCFTASATEAINLLLSFKKPPLHVVSSSLEHAATLGALQRLEKAGSKLSYLDPLPLKGAILPEQIEKALRPDTELMVFMAANNETGIKSDLEGIAALALQRKIPLIVDGVGAFGKEPLKIPAGVSGFVLSSHKIHGPSGAALAIARKSFRYLPQIVGGPQQYGKRAGSENLLAILGFAMAVELVMKNGVAYQQHLLSCQRRFEEGLKSLGLKVQIHGEDQSRVPGVSNVAFLGVDGETLLIQLDLLGVAASHGSACSSASLELSHVLLHMGIEPKMARSSLRFSFSRMTQFDEIDHLLKLIKQSIII